MKNKLFKRMVAIVAFLSMLALSAGNAFAVTKSTSVVSPYWQTDDDSYTFVAVSHTSLTGMNSEIGVVLTAMTEDGTTTFNTTHFTVTNAETTRVFIVATNHSTINSSNITGSDAIFVTGTTNATSGSLIFTPRSSNPTENREGTTDGKRGLTDITALSYWGAVVVATKSSGFAMEFIGDTHDSAFNQLTNVGGNVQQKPIGLN